MTQDALNCVSVLSTALELVAIFQGEGGAHALPFSSGTRQMEWQSVRSGQYVIASSKSITGNSFGCIHANRREGWTV
jgi:hypothetical protein